MIVIVDSREFLHLVDSDRPADKEEDKGQGIKPVVIAIKFLLAFLYCIFIWLDLGLVYSSLHNLHVLVFY